MSLASKLTDNMLPLGYLFSDDYGQTPTAAVAASYTAELGIFDFVADTNLVTVPFFPNADLPQILVVDSRSMKIVYKAGSYNQQALISAADGI